MRFESQIVKQICEELQKMPNVRHVCNKVGIDHSTFYRWTGKHHTFSQLVTAALLMGRDRISEAAEGVIITGIQNGDRKCSTYWLSHNNPRYSSREQALYLKGVNESVMEILEEPRPSDSSATFDMLFDMYEDMQEIFGLGSAKEKIDKFVKFACQEDPKLEEIFYGAYSEWKTNKDDLKKKEDDTRPAEENP
jgi:hypothetical protein